MRWLSLGCGICLLDIMPFLRQFVAYFAACSLWLVQADNSAFEPVDFDVAAALGYYGLNVSAISSSGFSKEQSIESACLAAVRMSCQPLAPRSSIAQ